MKLKTNDSRDFSEIDSTIEAKMASRFIFHGNINL